MGTPVSAKTSQPSVQQSQTPTEATTTSPLAVAIPTLPPNIEKESHDRTPPVPTTYADTSAGAYNAKGKDPAIDQDCHHAPTNKRSDFGSSNSSGGGGGGDSTTCSPQQTPTPHHEIGMPQQLTPLGHAEKKAAAPRHVNEDRRKVADDYEVARARSNYIIYGTGHTDSHYNRNHSARLTRRCYHRNPSEMSHDDDNDLMFIEEGCEAENCCCRYRRFKGESQTNLFHRGDTHSGGPSRPADGDASSAGVGTDVKSEVKPKSQPTVLSTIKALFLSSWLNMLLLVTPFAIVSYFQDWNGLAIFILNLISLIPLANLMGFVTEEIILRLNHILGALLSCTLGNAVEFITGIMALRQQKYEIIQMTMLGVVMANTMLVVGLAFFVGGCRYRDQYFNLTLAQTCTALMGLGVLSMIVPAAFTQVHAPNREVSWAILSLSRGTAIILLVVYILYIFFQLRTHSDVLKQRHEGAKSVVSWEERRRAKMASDSDDDLVAQQAAAGPEDKPLDGTTPRGCSTPTTIVAVPTENREKVLQQQAGEHSGDNDRRKAHGRNHGQRHTPQLVPWVALIFLSIVSVLVSLTVEILIHNIDHVTENWNLSSEFLGQIVLPATISVSERLMTISLAFKNEMDLTICIITGSSMQITLFVLPLLVIIAWIAGHNLPLQFDAFETTVMLISVLVINYVIVNGRSNWMKGSMLISAYAIVAMAFYFYPLDSDDKGGMSSAGLAILNKDT